MAAAVLLGVEAFAAGSSNRRPGPSDVGALLSLSPDFAAAAAPALQVGLVDIGEMSPMGGSNWLDNCLHRSSFSVTPDSAAAAAAPALQVGPVNISKTSPMGGSK
jgi:hypothetical protein